MAIIKNIHEILTRIATLKETEIDDTEDPDELYNILNALRELAAELRTIIGDTEETLGAKLRKDNKKLELPDGTLIASTWKAGSTKWDQRRLLQDLKAVIDQVRKPDPKTGEIANPVDVYEQLINKCIAINYARKTALQGIDLNPDVYKTEKPGRWGIRPITKTQQNKEKK